MRQRKLGAEGPLVSAIGLGCMGMSGSYGPADDRESIATIQAAVDAGVSLLDTGDFYGMGHNELLLRQALAGRRDKVFLAVKFGALRGPDGAAVGYDARPTSIKAFVAYSLVRLGTDYIDLYQPARIDPTVPIEETVGAIADLVRAGWVRYVGLSEASPATVRRARTVHPVTALEIEYSLACRGIETEILPSMRALGIGVIAYGVLCRGLLSGEVTAPPADAKDSRRRQPRFEAANLKHNLGLVDRLRALAAEMACTPAQLAIAWAAARGAGVVPLIGTRRRNRLAEALGALSLALTAEDLLRIEQAIPIGSVAGTRYGAAEMRVLDSEQPQAV